MQVTLEPPDQPEVITLIAALDAYQGALYPPESNYHLSIDALRQPNVLFAVAPTQAVSRWAAVPWSCWRTMAN